MASIFKKTMTCHLLQCMILILTVSAQTMAPSPVGNNLTIDEPTSAPSMPNITETLSPTRAPTKAPVMINTTAPSISKSPSAAPTPNATVLTPTVAMNTAAPVVAEGVSVTIDNLQITFTGVSTIASSDVLQFQATIEVWFEAYFNEVVGDNRQRYLQHHQNHRHLQQPYRVPDVRNMDTSYTVMSQDILTTSGSNSVTFTQTLSYSITSEPGKPQRYALLPFDDSAYKERLLKQLVTNIDSLIELSAISTPVIISEPLTIDDGGLSTGAIVGIVIAALFGLLFMACAGYLFGKQTLGHTDTTNSKEKETGENRTGAVNEHQNAANSPTLNTFVDPSTVIAEQQPYIPPTATNEARRGADPLAQAANGHVLNYKDQARTVICPIVEAIPDPKQPTSSSASIIPIANLVAL